MLRNSGLSSSMKVLTESLTAKSTQEAKINKVNVKSLFNVVISSLRYLISLLYYL